MVIIFRTTVLTKIQARKILERLAVKYPIAKCNFDLDDCDKILRVESEEIFVDGIVEAVLSCNIQCEILE